MDKVTKKQVFVFREIRSKYIEGFGSFNFSKYCVYDIIRRRRKEDTKTFEGSYKSIADYLNISKASVTLHVQSLLDKGLIKKNDFGLEMINDDIDNYILSENKRSFVILDFNIRYLINEDFKIPAKSPTRSKRKGIPEKTITLEQFAVLSIMFSMQINRYRSVSLSGVSRLLILSRGTVKKSIKILKQLGLLEENNKVPYDIIENYFFDLKRQILSNCNGLLREQLNIPDNVFS